MVRVEVDLGWQGRRFCRVGRGARGDDFDGGCRRDGGGAGGLAVLSRLLRRLRTDLEPEHLKRAKKDRYRQSARDSKNAR